MLKNFGKDLAFGIASQGLVTLAIGILIFAYPELLGMLVGAGLIIAGIVSLGLSWRIYRSTKKL